MLTHHEANLIAQLRDEEAARLLCELIRERSDYPPGDTRGAIGVVARWLGISDIPFQILAHREHQPNLLARLGPREAQPRLLFHSHIDTVGPGDPARWRHPPFDGVLENGKVFGRGAGDDKGSVAAQVLACLALARAGVELDGALELAVVADEESGAREGTLWLRQEGRLETEALVVGEQTDNRIAIAERVACGIDLTIRGRSTHGAMPWAGDNAILKAARVLGYLERKLFPRLAARMRPFLPPATLNVGRIQGGAQWNIVPDSCKIEMDRRLLPGESREQAMGELRTLLDEYSASVEPLAYELFTQGEVAANVNTAPDHPLVAAAQQTLQDVSNEDRPLTGYVQTSDGRWFARDGIPILIFGPSDPSVGHSTDEHVSVAQVVEAARFYALLAARWLAGRTNHS